MINGTTTNLEHKENGYWNLSKETDIELLDMLKLIVRVIPIAYIFRCEDHNEHIRLIIIADQHQYQASDHIKMILNFVAIGYSNIHLMYFSYGTIIDFLRRGHLFFSVNCISANCIFKRKGLEILPEGSNLCTSQLKEEALRTFALEIEKASNFFKGAELYIEQGKLNMTAFMLHQTCEQLYRLIILVFRGKDFKSHLLPVLRKEAAFYFPEIYNVFHAKEGKELKWISLLQTSYLGARYQNDYSIAFKECVFLMEKIQLLLSNLKTELFKSL